VLPAGSAGEAGLEAVVDLPGVGLAATGLHDLTDQGVGGSQHLVRLADQKTAADGGLSDLGGQTRFLHGGEIDNSRYNEAIK